MDRIIDQKTALQAAKLTSILPSSLLAGYCLAFSQNGVSQLYDERPHTSVPLFKRIFLTGARVAIPFSLISAVSSSYLAYAIPAQRRLWATAAVAALAVRPWTGLVMMPGIKKLMALASADKDVLDKSEQTLQHRQLMTRWVKQNFVRTTILLVGSVAGLWATVTA